MEFIMGLPLMEMRHESILVVYDTLMKSAHFIPMRMTYRIPDIARFFINEIVRLYGFPRRILFDQGSIFTGQFRTSFQEALATRLNFSTSYHLETNGLTEGMNQILEVMLRMYVLNQQKCWEDFLPLVDLRTTTTIKVSLVCHHASFSTIDRFVGH